MAESIGFEPMLPLRGGRLSKPLPSTTRPTLLISYYTTIITPSLNVVNDYLAEDVRFELTEPFSSTVFKTAAFNHSANPLN